MEIRNFKSEDMKMKWKTVFKDTFHREEIGGNWVPILNKEAWSIKEQKLYCGKKTDPGGISIELAHRINSEDICFEYECYSNSSEPRDLNAYFTKSSGDWRKGYFYGFGTECNTSSQVFAYGQTIGTNYRYVVTHGKRYHVKALKQGDLIRLSINGKVVIEVLDITIGEENLLPGYKVGLLMWLENSFITQVKISIPETKYQEKENNKEDILIGKQWKRKLGDYKELVGWQKEILNSADKISNFKKNLQLMTPWANINVNRSLVDKGEKISFEFECCSCILPDRKIVIYPRYLESDFRNREVYFLDWKEDRKFGIKTLYRAKYIYRPKEPGNYLLKWRSGVGDSYEEYSRYFAVINENYAVCNIWVGTHRHSYRIDEIIHNHYLPADFYNINECKQRTSHAYSLIREYTEKYGDSIMRYNLLPKQGNLFLYPQEIQKSLINTYRYVWEKMGIKFDNFGEYTLGNATVKAAKDLGIYSITSMCPEQNQTDGDWQINHWGMPIRPFFMNTEDFRKPGYRGHSPVVGSSMTERHPTLARIGETCSNYCLTPDNRKREISGCPYPDEISMSRFYDFFNTHVKSNYQETPFFFVVGVENFLGDPEWSKTNILGLEYMVKTAKEEALVFASSKHIARYFIEHYDKTPETVIYLPDIYCGVSYRQSRYILKKTSSYPDIIQMEGDEFQVAFEEDKSIPTFLYDYKSKWNYPAWGNEKLPRIRNAMIDGSIPEIKYKMTPKVVDTRRYNVRIDLNRRECFIEYNISVVSPEKRQSFPVAIWYIPLEFTNSDADIRAGKGCRFVSIKDSSTDNFHGILVCKVQRGENIFKLRITGKERKPKSNRINIKDTVFGKVTKRDRIVITYLWINEDTEKVKVVLKVPEGREKVVFAVTIPYGRKIYCDNLNKININLTGKYPWVRVIGLSKIDITMNSVLMGVKKV